MQSSSCPVFNQQSSPRERYYCALTKSSLIVQVVMKNLCSITDTLVSLPVIRLQDMDPLFHQLIVLHQCSVGFQPCGRKFSSFTSGTDIYSLWYSWKWYTVENPTSQHVRLNSCWTTRTWLWQLHRLESQFLKRYLSNVQKFSFLILKEGERN